MEKTKEDKRWVQDFLRIMLVLSASVGLLFSVCGTVTSVFIVNGRRNCGSPVIWIGLLLLFPALAFLSLRRALRVRVCAVVLCILLAFGSFFFLAVSTLLGTVYKEPVTFTSPDGAYEVTAREWAVFKGSGAELTFRRAGRLFASETVNVYTGDCIFPFSDGNCEAVWEGNAVAVRYDTPQGEETVFYRFEE